MSENTMNNLKIGVDVGGTKIEAVLVDAMGTVLGSARIPARHGNDAVIEDIVAVAHQAAGERFDEVRAIGVGTPGTVDSANGHVGNIVNLDVVSLDMGPLVSQRSGVPAHVENDVNAAAVGAATVLGGADGMAGTIAFLNFGTGLAVAARPAKSAISQSNLIASSALAGNTDAWKQSARAHPWGVCGPTPPRRCPT